MDKNICFHWEFRLKQYLEEDLFHRLMFRIFQDGVTKWNVWLGGGGAVGKHKYTPTFGGLCWSRAEDSAPLTDTIKAEIEDYLRSLPECDVLVTSPFVSLDDGDGEADYQFHLECDRILGPDGARHCPGSYIWMRGEWQEPDGTPVPYDKKSASASYVPVAYGCARCRAATDKNGNLV